MFKSDAISYYPAVDFLRGLGALVILIWHYHHFYFDKPYFGPVNGYPSWDFARQPLYELLMPLYHHGGWAVQFFWMLSGFVFAFVYSRRDTSARSFFVLRFSRLYPLHFASLLIIAALQYTSLNMFGQFQILEINDLKHFVLNLFFAQHWGLQDGYSFNSVSWSISLEELVYWSFWLFSAFLGFRSLKSSLIATLVSAVMVFLIGGYAWAFFFFFAGAAVYYWQESQPYRFNLYAALITGLVALLMVATNPNVIVLFDFAGRSLTIPFSDIFLNVTAASAFATLILLASAIDKSGSLRMMDKQFKFVGSLTYSTYMLHLPLQVLVLMFVSYFGINRAVFDSPLMLLMFIGLMVFIGRLSYVYFERPAQAYIRERYMQPKARLVPAN